ncbi:MAG: WbqC family protein [Deltaproteobacteria bacterium]|nr:WbqC family protein [Deltaproteobacteria bacterium]
MKIISAHQPYFAPYAGFFEKAMRSDVLVIMDAVQFPRGTTWLTRNRFKNDQGTLWLTIPVWKKGLGLQKINEVKICYEGHWQKKHMASLSSAYANAPFFEDHRSFLEKIFSEQMSSLLELNMRIIRYVLAQLAIETHIVTLSELGIEAKEPELSIISLPKAQQENTWIRRGSKTKESTLPFSGPKFRFTLSFGGLFSLTSPY